MAIFISDTCSTRQLCYLIRFSDSNKRYSYMGNIVIAININFNQQPKKTCIIPSHHKYIYIYTYFIIKSVRLNKDIM